MTAIDETVVSRAIDPKLTGDRPGNRRERRRRRDKSLEVEPGLLVEPTAQGELVRRSARKAKRGWYAPAAEPALSTTRQAEVLNTALVAAPTSHQGIMLGLDLVSGSYVSFDPFTGYESGLISSPTVVVLGVVGSGKSTFVKDVFIIRALIDAMTRSVVVDKKDRGGEGEYAELCRRFGSEPFTFRVGGGGVRLNILDPMIVAGTGVGGQARLLVSMAELAQGGEPLGVWEHKALRAALTATLRVAEQDNQVPVLEHLLAQCGRIHPEFASLSPSAKERMHQAGLTVRFLLDSLVADELAGLFDGPTSKNIQLQSRLTSFDVSQLPDDGPAVSMVMAISNVWLLGTLKHQRGLRTYFVAEEGWHLIDGPGGKVLQRNTKLARPLGLVNVPVMHHIDDVPAGSPATAVIQEAEMVVLFRQSRDSDIERCMREFGLARSSRGTLGNLATGQSLLKIGRRREIHLEHVRSRFERGVTNTDEAMILDQNARTLR